MKLSPPRLLLHLEGLVLLVLAVTLYARSEYSWLAFAIGFLLPDLSMLGYLAGLKVGASVYNAFHTYLAPVGLFLILSGLGIDRFHWVLLIWGAHIAFDRLMGYGLKYETAFKDTHLQRL